MANQKPPSSLQKPANPMLSASPLLYLLTLKLATTFKKCSPKLKVREELDVLHVLPALRTTKPAKQSESKKPGKTGILRYGLEAQQLINEMHSTEQQIMKPNVKKDPALTKLEKLIACCKSGTLEQVMQAMKFVPNVNAVAHGSTPLIAACVSNRIPIVDALVKEGHANVNYFRHRVMDIAAIHATCSYGYLELAAYLIDHGANVNLAAGERWMKASPLYMAARKGDVAMISLLLQKGADVEMPAKTNSTPLFTASKCGHADAVKLLIETGKAQVHRIVSAGLNSLIVACNELHYDVVDILLTIGNADPNCVDLYGQTPLYVACQFGNYALASRLLKSNADVNKKTTSGETPLFTACKQAYFDIVDLLLDYGADPNISQSCEGTEMYSSPIFLCCNSGCLRMAELLFYKGKADLHKPLENGVTPFIAGKKHSFFIPFLQQGLVTFLCGYHARCGANSILQNLPYYVFIDIAKLIPH